MAGVGGWGRNVYNATQWASMETNGAVFLPAASIRFGTKLYTNGNDEEDDEEYIEVQGSID